MNACLRVIWIEKLVNRLDNQACRLHLRSIRITSFAFNLGVFAAGDLDRLWFRDAARDRRRRILRHYLRHPFRPRRQQMVTIRVASNVLSSHEGRAEARNASISPYSASRSQRMWTKRRRDYDFAPVLPFAFFGRLKDSLLNDRLRCDYGSAVRWNKDESGNAQEPRHCEPQQSSDLKRETHAKSSLIGV
jgi:hypothetical protein